MSRGQRSASAAAPEAAAAKELEREVEEIVSGDGPIVVGPWRSEVGYEVLYWIPFLRWLTRRYAIPRDRLIAFSRGGARAWYEPICASYVDALELVDLEAYRRGAAAAWRRAYGQKQSSVAPWDEQLLEAARERLGAQPRLLHPSLMYRLFGSYWKGRASIRHVLDHTRYEPWPRPSDEEIERLLPPSFVAAKFYFRGSFPDTAGNRALAAGTLERLAADGPVVLLNTEVQADEHEELDPRSGSLLRPLANVDPARNLHAQSVVLSRAGLFVGTCGGPPYLASAYGVPAVALLSDPSQFPPHHLDLARRFAAATGTGFVAVDASSVAQLAVPGAAVPVALL